MLLVYKIAFVLFASFNLTRIRFLCEYQVEVEQISHVILFLNEMKKSISKEHLFKTCIWFLTDSNYLADESFSLHLNSIKNRNFVFVFQVIYLKGEKTSDMIVLDPRWLCGSICGHFLSPQFTSQAR